MKLRYIALLVCLVISGCAGAKPTNPPLSFTPEKRTFTDDLGRTVSVPVEIKRIVSLAPSASEMVYAVGAGDRLVGVTTFCNYPEQALEVAKIGDTMNPNMETIVALKPDIVLVSTASQIENFTKTLEQNGIAVYVSDPTTFHDLREGLDNLGIIFGTTATSDEMSGQLYRRERALALKLGTDLQKGESPQTYDERVGSVRVFVQISKEPLFTIGKAANLLNTLIVFSGGRSVTENVETAYPKLSKETASTLQPDVIILSDSEDNREPNEVFANSPAVKNKRILKVNADILSRPGPRLIDAMEQIARFLHPEKFK